MTAVYWRSPRKLKMCRSRTTLSGVPIWSSIRVLAALALALAGLWVAACSAPPQESPKPVQKSEPVSTPVTRKRPDAATGSVIAAIKERGELLVGMQVGYVPFQMTGSDGSLIGLDVDAGEMVARDLMVNLKIVRLSWQELIPSLLKGEIDVIMSGMQVTPARNAEVLFTDPILETGRMFLVHKSNAARFQKFKDLNQSGVFIVSTASGLSGLPVREVLSLASYREFPSRKLAVTEVLEKRAHALIDEEFFIRYTSASRPESLVARFDPITYERIAWAVRPGETHWLNWLNNFIGMIRHDGRLDKLKKKWLQDYFLDIHSTGGQ